jgi:hypothetical protein
VLARVLNLSFDKGIVAMLKTVLTVASILIPGLFLTQNAIADEKKAICEFYNHGDLKKDRTGPCTFSRNDEDIKIKLANDKVYRLIEESKRKGHYVDQDGNRLDVKESGGYKLTYRWKNQRLIVMLAES